MYTHTSTVALIWTSIHTLIREALSHVCPRTHALRLFTHTRYPRPKYNISYSNIQSHVNILFHSHQSADCWFTPTPWLTYGWQTTCLVHTVAAWPYMQRSDMWFCRVFFFPAAFNHHSIWKNNKLFCFKVGPDWLAATQHGDKQVRAYEIHKALCRLSVCAHVHACLVGISQVDFGSAITIYIFIDYQAN